MSREAHNNKAHFKYYVGDVPLKKLCEQEKVPYNKVMGRYYDFNARRMHSCLTDSQKFIMIIDEIKEELRYMNKNYVLSNGENIFDICKENGTDSSIAARYIDDNVGTTSLTSDELIHKAIEYAATYTYYLDGESVEDICEREGIEDVVKVKRDIVSNIKRHPKNDKDSIIRNCIEKAKIECEAKYVIGEQPLSSLCKEYDVPSRKVIDEYIKRMNAKAKEEGIELNTSIVDGKVLKAAFEDVISKVTRGTDNVIDDLPLPYYCKQHGYPTEKILIFKNALRINDKISSDEDLIRHAIAMYLELKDKDLKPQIFRNLKECNDPNQLAYNCCLLNLNLDRVLQLCHTLHLTNYQAFSLVWFLGNAKNKAGEYTLTPDNETKIFSIVNGLEHKTIDPMQLPFPGLYRIYKCDLIDYDALQREKEEKKKRDKIIVSVLSEGELIPVELPIIYTTVNTICAEKGLKPTYLELDEYRKVVRDFLIQAMDSCYEKSNDKITKYINEYLRTAFENYLTIGPDVLVKTFTSNEEQK